MKKQALNPYLPSWEYIPDGEPHVFGDRVYIYGSHDKNGVRLGERPQDEPQFDPGVLTEGNRTYLYTGFCGRGDKFPKIMQDGRDGDTW